MDIYIFTSHMSLGKKLKKYRTEKGITQTALAKSIGIYQKNISDYEKDSVVPSITMIKKIADALGVSLDHLMSSDPHIIKDKRIVRICKELDRMEEPDKDAILKVIEALLRDNKLKKLI
jgi:transcriptional regulator with XRE-family HTH domain